MSEHEDLEDGEIEDDDDDEVQIISEPEPALPAPILLHSAGEWDDEENVDTVVPEKVVNVKHTVEVKVRKSDENTPTKSKKRSKPGPVVDDWATSVENALANALKKDGVQPPMPSISSRQEDNDEIPTKRKKRDKHKKKSNQEKITQLEEIDLEYEMMNVRGGSPRPSTVPSVKLPDRSDTEDSYTSDDSRDRERERDRERDRERRDRDRERDREYNRRKRKNRQRNRANRDNRKRKRDDSEDEKHHGRGNGPRKMELCKFYLMDCCAKREKCLYMHSDFPCKYYYLGLKCKEKDKCLFSHGEPLTDELRGILMKHLETAPQEILGDFPRISRESATNMVNATHRKLLEKFGMSEKVAEAESNTSKIPSLLEMMASNDRSNKNRKSRWCEKNLNLSGLSEDFLSLKHLSGVISADQIGSLEKMGIHNLDQISQLTVAQLNELGLSIGQIHELQLNALNMKKLRENLSKQGSKGDDSDNHEQSAASSVPHNQDMDLRITPQSLDLNDSAEVPPLGDKDVDMRFLSIEKSIKNENTPDTPEENSNLMSNSFSGIIKPPTVDYSQYLKDSNINDDDDVDTSENVDQLMIDQDDDDDDDDENNLKISIEDEEPNESENNKNDCEETDNASADQTPFYLQPAIFDPKLVDQPLAKQKIDYTESFGMYKSTDEEELKPNVCILDQYGSDGETSKQKADSSNRKSMYSYVGSSSESPGASSPSTVFKQVGSPNNNTQAGWTPTSIITSSNCAKTTYQLNKPVKISIYDKSYGSDNSEDDDDAMSKDSLYTDKDKDMRLNFLDLDSKVNESSTSIADVDLRLPFKPMTNYIPATEIDASILSHPPIAYKVHEVEIPKPNYKDIRRNTARPERTKDPRLRRIFGMRNDDESENNPKDSLLAGIRSPKSSGTPAPIVPRIDPRTKRLQDSTPKIQSPTSNSACNNNSTSNNGNPNTSQIDVQAVLQKSSWYMDLSSKNKITVNQQLAILSTEMKKFHSSDRSTEKLAQFMQFLAGNQMLQFILSNLNVYVDDSVSFCEVPLVPSQPPPLMSVPPPNINMPPIRLLPPVNIPPPVNKPPSLFDLPRFNCPPEVRPGLLGVAPNMPIDQFLAMGQINKNNNPPPLLDEWNDDYEWDDNPNSSGFTPNFERNPNNFNNSRNNNMRNNNRGGNNFRNNDRWSNASGGGGGNNSNRRNNNHRRMDKNKK